MVDSALQIENVSKSFTVGNQEVKIVKNVSFSVKKGDFLIIFGPSGCGKSTLLHMILGLEIPTLGKITFMGEDLYRMEVEDQRSNFRKQHVGMVFQQANWIKSLTVIENVAFPLLLIGIDKIVSLQKAMKTLESVGMLQWAHYIPTELSSGQQQRVALARALISDPAVIVADEPTGNLDFESGQQLMQLLVEVSSGTEKTVIMVTHDLEYLKYSTTAVRMFNGEVVGVYSGKEKEALTKEIKSKRGIGVGGVTV